MHAKERVMAPILRDELGLTIELAKGLDTDRFGTFSREVPRTGTQMDAARAKILAGFECTPGARVGLASEGSFGPHPEMPFWAIGRELVLLIDRQSGLEVCGWDVSSDTNFSQEVVRDVAAARAFAERVMFPEHGVILIGCQEESPAPALMVDKSIQDFPGLEISVTKALRSFGAVSIEADMRAHRNPTRMAAIARATRDLVRRFNRRCSQCSGPGFDVVTLVPGLPCAWCGEPTSCSVAEVLACKLCGHREERKAAVTHADPGQCASCNP
jgi:hypothetical protein